MTEEKNQPEKNKLDENKIAGFDEKQAREIVLDTIGEKENKPEIKKEVSLDFSVLDNIQKAGEKINEPEEEKESLKNIQEAKTELEQELKDIPEVKEIKEPEIKEKIEKIIPQPIIEKQNIANHEISKEPVKNELISEEHKAEEKSEKHLEKKVEKSKKSIEHKKKRQTINLKEFFKKIKNNKIIKDTVYAILLISITLLIAYLTFSLFVI